MYVKKSIFISICILLVITTAAVSIGIINPFGFFAIGDMLKLKYQTMVLEDYYYGDFNRSNLVNGALYGVAAILGDPYTTYIDKENATTFISDVEGKYVGVGMYIEESEDDGRVTVVSAIRNSPAEKAGIASGDKILQVDGVEVFESNTASKMLRNGSAGTDVKLMLHKAANNEVIDLTITREKIARETVNTKVFNDTIGYFEITDFAQDTANEFADRLIELDANSLTGIIIDLRNNPGGLVESAINLCELFLSKDEVVVFTLDNQNKRNDYKTHTEYSIDIPMVILINSGSASSSEIFAGAMRDHGVAKLVGDKSFGKGLVQTTVPMWDGSMIKVTTSEYFSPNGNSINQIGITPDVEISLPEGHPPLSKIEAEDDLQLQKALEVLNI